MSAAIAVIIRCFNEEAHIARLLTGIRKQTVAVDRVILVDSGSTDATLSIAAAFGVETVGIAPERFSFGRALNRGLERAGAADYAVIASAHVYPVYDTWLERLLAPLEEDDVALAYGRQITPPGGRLSERRLLEQWFPLVSASHQTTPFCNNANAAIKRALWERQRYDEDLTGLEDLAWARQAMLAGHRISYVAEAPVVHVHNERFEQVLNRYRREAISHKRLYDDQRMSALTAARLAAANIAGDCKVAIGERLPIATAWDIMSFRVAQFLGTYQGFKQAGPVTESLRRRFYYPDVRRAGGATSRQEPAGNVIDYEERQD